MKRKKLPKEFKKGALVWIAWLDHQSHHGWKDPDEFTVPTEETMRCESAGWVVGQSDLVVCIFQSKAPPCRSVADGMCILRADIVDWCFIEDA